MRKALRILYRLNDAHIFILWENDRTINLHWKIWLTLVHTRCVVTLAITFKLHIEVEVDSTLGSITRSYLAKVCVCVCVRIRWVEVRLWWLDWLLLRHKKRRRALAFCVIASRDKICIPVSLSHSRSVSLPPSPSSLYLFNWKHKFGDIPETCMWSKKGSGWWIKGINMSLWN